MTNVERIYALYVEANPYPEPDSLPETYDESHHRLRLIKTDTRQIDRIEPLGSANPVIGRPRYPIRSFAIAAVVVLLLGLGVAMFSGSRTQGLAPSTQLPPPSTPVEQATEFMARLESGDVVGAAQLLSDPLGTVWFIPMDHVNSTEQIADYLDFYVAIGVETKLSGCRSETVGPRQVVTCRADQQSEALLPLGLEFPPFDMTFEVGSDGIRTIGWVQDDLVDFNIAFNDSRFFEFRKTVLAPRGLIQSSGAPVWSRENGILMGQLVQEFVAETG